MKHDRTMLLAYAAGIIDGEGSIDLHRYTPGPKNRLKNENWCLRLQVKMNHGAPLELLHGLFGGNIYLQKDNQYLKKGGIFPGFTWSIGNSRAAEVLKLLLPYLKVKKTQARLGIRYYQRIKIQRSKNDKSGLSSREMKIRRKLVNDLRLANRNKVYIPRAGLETEQVERAKALMRQSNLIENQQ